MKHIIWLGITGAAMTFLLNCGPVDMNDNAQLGQVNDVTANVVDQDDALSLNEQGSDNFLSNFYPFYYAHFFGFYPGLFGYRPFAAPYGSGLMPYYPWYRCVPTVGVATVVTARPGC